MCTEGKGGTRKYFVLKALPVLPKLVPPVGVTVFGVKMAGVPGMRYLFSNAVKIVFVPVAKDCSCSWLPALAMNGIVFAMGSKMRS